ncbi:hypothetical protein CDIMF43_80022 [Carnobacterium divergens]|nr:hypothetical protein CDIV41_10024 [Carnobacterium divergens]SPC41780.1 hypothetical protein CDIMF43_80022 [Carnobacterium divergens]
MKYLLAIKVVKVLYPFLAIYSQGVEWALFWCKKIRRSESVVIRI